MTIDAQLVLMHVPRSFGGRFRHGTVKPLPPAAALELCPSEPMTICDTPWPALVCYCGAFVLDWEEPQ